ncbi:homing endonuclease [Vibrio phage PVA23]|nr:homing endonuclease [Vibrio phage PVA23]
MLMNGNGYNRANSVSSRTLASIREKHAEHMSDTMKGNTNAAGVVFSDERKKNISNAKKGRFSEKQRRALEKNWDSAKGRKDSDETRKKRSDAMKSNGFVPVKAGDFETCSNAGKANKGVKKSFRSETHIENLKKSLPRGKDHSCAKSLYVDGVSYDTMKSAAEALGITVDAIRYRCKSKSKKFENYQFA